MLNNFDQFQRDRLVLDSPQQQQQQQKQQSQTHANEESMQAQALGSIFF